jgi:hypothetical protein
VIGYNENTLNAIKLTANDGRPSRRIVVDVTVTKNGKLVGEEGVIFKNTYSERSLLLARVIARGTRTQTIDWTRVADADGYYIYFAKCNTLNPKRTYKLKKVKTIKGNSTFKWKNTRKLKRGVKYKYYVAAYKNVGGKAKIIKKSLSAHSMAETVYKNHTNVKSVKIKSKRALTLKRGRTSTIKAKPYGYQKGKYVFWKTHAAKLRYKSEDTRIAKVNSKGRITAVKKGTVKVYVLGVNGVRSFVTVTVR